MIVFSRDLARRFRTLARRCISGRPRGPGPQVLVVVRRGVRTLSVGFEEVRLTHAEPTDEADGALLLPMAAFEATEGTGDEPVFAEQHGPTQVVLNWADRGLPRSQAFEVTVSEEPAPPDRPRSTVAIPARLLKALHECGRTTTTEAMRYALNRIQVSGKLGQVAGTDSHQALVARGFQFPFTDEVLIPAVPIFAAKEFAGSDEVRLGRTAKALTVSIGPWCVSLRIDRDGRFPDVQSVIPRQPSPTVLLLDDADAVELLDRLPSLPGHGDEHSPITLDLAGRAAVRAKGENSDKIREVPLTRSTVRGKAVRIALDRLYLRRLLLLGLREIRIADPDKPLIATASDLLYLAMPLGTDAIVEPGGVSTPLIPPSSPNPLRRTSPMKAHESNGTAIPPTNPVDPLVEAEGLRTALGDAHQRLGRLIALLRGRTREKKALATVWAGLKQLNLRP